MMGAIILPQLIEPIVCWCLSMPKIMFWKSPLKFMCLLTLGALSLGQANEVNNKILLEWCWESIVDLFHLAESLNLFVNKQRNPMQVQGKHFTLRVGSFECEQKQFSDTLAESSFNFSSFLRPMWMVKLFAFLYVEELRFFLGEILTFLCLWMKTVGDLGALNLVNDFWKFFF